jgi:hypothetical protein
MLIRICWKPPLAILARLGLVTAISGSTKAHCFRQIDLVDSGFLKSCGIPSRHLQVVSILVVMVIHDSWMIWATHI